jgi:hypothetical protein
MTIDDERCDYCIAFPAVAAATQTRPRWLRSERRLPGRPAWRWWERGYGLLRSGAEAYSYTVPTVRLLAPHRHTLATAHPSALNRWRASKAKQNIIRNISKDRDGRLKSAKSTIDNICLGVWIGMPWSGGIFTDVSLKITNRPGHGHSPVSCSSFCCLDLTVAILTALQSTSWVDDQATKTPTSSSPASTRA